MFLLFLLDRARFGDSSA